MPTDRKPLWKPRYWPKLPKQQKEAAFNGIGPKFFPAWLRRLLDGAFFWLADAAYIHDVEYTYSSVRLLADFRFFVNAAILAGFDMTRQAVNVVAFIGLAFGGRRAWKESRLDSDDGDVMTGDAPTTDDE